MMSFRHKAKIQAPSVAPSTEPTTPDRVPARQPPYLVGAQLHAAGFPMSSRPLLGSSRAILAAPKRCWICSVIRSSRRSRAARATAPHASEDPLGAPAGGAAAMSPGARCCRASARRDGEAHGRAHRRPKRRPSGQNAASNVLVRGVHRSEPTSALTSARSIRVGGSASRPPRRATRTKRVNRANTNDECIAGGLPDRTAARRL